MVMTIIDVPLGHIASVRLFASLPEGYLATLAAACTERCYENEEVIFLKGDVPAGLFAVVSGKVKLVCQSPAGDEKVIDIRLPGDVFGEECLLLGQPYGYLAVALSKTCLLHLDRQALLALLNGSSDFALTMLAHMSHRIFAGMRDIENFRIRSPLERLAHYIFVQCAADRRPKPKVILHAPKHVIASRLGMTPESLSRCLHDMAEVRILDIRGPVLTILNRERLGGLAG